MERKEVGGQKIRALRERQGLTQRAVEIAVNLGINYVQRIENGRTIPKPDTLSSILNFLDASFTEQRNIFNLFGYALPTPPPTHEERLWAIETIHSHLYTLPFPAYILDCTDSLLDWNSLVLNITGKTRQEMEQLRYMSLNNLLFDEYYGLTQLVAEPDDLFPNILRAFWSETQPYQDEQWCKDMIETACTELPLFKHYWDKITHTPQSPRTIVLRPALPIGLNVPLAGRLDFRISSDYLLQDTRFRVVYYVPANAKTMHQCACWIEAEGENDVLSHPRPKNRPTAAK